MILDVTLFDWVPGIFDTLSSWRIGGVSMVGVIIFLLVVTGIGFLVRGNK